MSDRPDQTWFFTEDFLKKLENKLENPATAFGWEAGRTSFHGGFLAIPHTTGSNERLQAMRGQRQTAAAIDRQRKPAPSSLNWEKQRSEYLSPVVYQGYCASCVAFGVTAAIETTARWQEEKPELPKLSEAHLFFLTKQRCWAGWTVEEALNQAKDNGICRDEDYDYEPYNQPSKVPPDSGKKLTRISGFTRFNPPDDGPSQEMRDWLKNRGPLIALIEARPDFFLYRSGTYEPIGTFGQDRFPSHCVCCVGFDDSLDKGRGAYRCRNSFGTNWGEDGYFWVRYDKAYIDVAMWGIDGFEVIDGEPTSPGSET